MKEYYCDFCRTKLKLSECCTIDTTVVTPADTENAYYELRLAEVCCNCSEKIISFMEGMYGVESNRYGYK